MVDVFINITFKMYSYKGKYTFKLSPCRAQNIYRNSAQKMET